MPEILSPDGADDVMTQLDRNKWRSLLLVRKHDIVGCMATADQGQRVLRVHQHARHRGRVRRRRVQGAPPFFHRRRPGVQQGERREVIAIIVFISREG